MVTDDRNRQSPERGKTAGGAGYLDLPFMWVPTKRFGHGQTTEYQLPLGHDTVALLGLVAGKGWEMSIARGGGETSARGLFATPHDALMVLVAEFGGRDLPR